MLKTKLHLALQLLHYLFLEPIQLKLKTKHKKNHVSRISVYNIDRRHK